MSKKIVFYQDIKNDIGKILVKLDKQINKTIELIKEKTELMNYWKKKDFFENEKQRCIEFIQSMVERLIKLKNDLIDLQNKYIPKEKEKKLNTESKVNNFLNSLK